MEKIIVGYGEYDHSGAHVYLSESEVNKELAAGWKLKDIRIEKNRTMMNVIYVLEK